MVRKELPAFFIIHPEVAETISRGRPVVALESTVITHGLPYPENLQLARDMEAQVRAQGALPATIAVLEGMIRVGLERDELTRLATQRETVKISSRDFAIAIAKKQSGGTTVAGTLVAAHLAGLKVFATGGIGGVHRQAPFDVSADLQALAHTPMVVVCSGAKAILDLPATLETLETLRVPVLGYQTHEFPAFYSLSSGLKLGARADTPHDIAKIACAHWGMRLESAILVAQPPPEEEALDANAVETAIQSALTEAQAGQISGSEVTPFLLRRVSELTGGASLRANLALLRNNAILAAQVACALSSR